MYLKIVKIPTLFIYFRSNLSIPMLNSSQEPSINQLRSLIINLMLMKKQSYMLKLTLFVEVNSQNKWSKTLDRSEEF
jgi:hypothetical protein